MLRIECYTDLAQLRAGDPMRKSSFVPSEIHDYLIAHGTTPDATQRALSAETEKFGGIAMLQIAPETRRKNKRQIDGR
jgi:hypothetical protein